MVIYLEQSAILQDLLQSKIANEMFYNECLIYIKIWSKTGFHPA